MTISIQRRGDRFAEESLCQRMRVSERICEAGVPFYALAQREVLRLIYRFNPIRHARYLLTHVGRVV